MKFKQLITRFTYISLILMATNAFSEENNANPVKQATETPVSALGFNAGWVVGNGLLYRKYSGKNIYQGTFAGLIDKDKDEAYVNISGSYARYLNRFNFKTTLGLKGIVGMEGVYDKSNGVTDNRVNIGAGIGVDLGNVQKQGIVISLDLIYTAGFEANEGKSLQTLSLKSALGLLYNF